MARTTGETSRERQIVRDALDRAAVLLILAAAVHATVRIVPLELPPLNFTVNESPLFKVSADP